MKPLKDEKTARGAEKVAERRAERVQSSTSLDNIPAFSASNIDDALDLLAISGATASGGSSGSRDVERHPERRVRLTTTYLSYALQTLELRKFVNQI